jgi:CubicO group peptidase (beta-lactamase class C family)
MQKGFRRVAAGFLVAILTNAPNRSLCQTPQQIRSVGEFYAHTDGFSGNVVVFRNDSIISNESYGLANIELGAPITAKTRFAIGSLTKQFTAASILLLQEEGLLKTTDTLAQHYPATPALWKDVTLRQLLQHTSGIPTASKTGAPRHSSRANIHPRTSSSPSPPSPSSSRLAVEWNTTTWAMSCWDLL